MKNYQIYYHCKPVGVVMADFEQEAICTFMYKHPGYNSWELSAFEIIVP